MTFFNFSISNYPQMPNFRFVQCQTKIMAKIRKSSWCMIKIFWGAGVVTPSKPPPPYEQLLPLPTLYFKMFLERSLNDPPPPTTPLQAPFTAAPLPIHHPFPPKNFDCTLGPNTILKIFLPSNIPSAMPMDLIDASSVWKM